MIDWLYFLDNGLLSYSNYTQGQVSNSNYLFQKKNNSFSSSNTIAHISKAEVTTDSGENFETGDSGIPVLQHCLLRKPIKSLSFILQHISSKAMKYKFE